MFVLMVAAAVVLGTIGSRRSSDDRYKVPELPPIPKFELDRKLFDYKPLDLEKIDPSLLAPPDIDPSLLLPSQPVPKPLHAPVRTTKATKPK
jgi:hypothetical protein